MTVERREKDYYGTKRSYSDAELQRADLQTKAEFRMASLGRIRSELVAQQSSAEAAAQIESSRLETLYALLGPLQRTDPSDGDAVDALITQTPNELSRRILESFKRGGEWHHEFARPPMIHRQNDLVRSRGVRIQEYLDWLRSVQFSDRGDGERATDMLGSSFSGAIPPIVNASTVSVDHTVPQSWMTRAETLFLNGTVREDLVQCTLVTRSENSSKGNKPIFLSTTDVDLVDSADKSLYRLTPRDAQFFTDTRKAVVARCIAYAFSCYMLLGENGGSAWSSFATTTGCAYWASLASVGNADVDPSRQDDTLLQLMDSPVGDLERLAAMVLFSVVGWSNPFISDPVRDPRVVSLLRQRLGGDTRIPSVMLSGLRGQVLGLM
jgi:hypothetical protein